MVKIVIENLLLLMVMFSKKLIFRSHWVRGSKPTRCLLKIWLKNKGIIETKACFLMPQSLILGMIHIRILRNISPPPIHHQKFIIRANDG